MILSAAEGPWLSPSIPFSQPLTPLPVPSAGTVTNVGEASTWLGYTYLFVRMLKNPMAYGIPWEELAMEPRLEARRRALVQDAARKLEQVHSAGPSPA